jgi:hypothetical protein
MTVPVAAASPCAGAEPQSPRRPWKPDGDDHLIYRWVKLEGRSQVWVAQAFGIHQSTVSRILQRYDRWQAHAREREDGRLDPAERLRAQRWLSFERNELIIQSCLRLAGDLEGCVDASRSTIRRPWSDPTAESEVRTEHFTLDRTGMAARFLRLAFRVNMEQLKLAEHDQPPLPAPLTAEESAEEERQALADAEELATARRHRGADIPDCQEAKSSVGSAHEGAAADETSAEDSPIDPAGRTDTKHPFPAPAPTLNLEPGTLNAAVADSLTHHLPTPLHALHILHTENPSENAINPTPPCTCAADCGETENLADSCILDIEPPSLPGNIRSTCVAVT